MRRRLLALLLTAGILGAAEDAAPVAAEPALGSTDSQVNETLCGQTWAAKIGNATYAFTFARAGTCVITEGSERTGTWRDLPGQQRIVVTWEGVPLEDAILYDLEEGRWYYVRAGFSKVRLERKKTAEELREERQAARERREEEEDAEEEEERRKQRQDSFDKLLESTRHKRR